METAAASEEPARRVFISYSSADRHRVDGLERLLDLFGHKVFLDFKQIRLGSRWTDEIKSALDQTDTTLVYWTRSASSSEWVRNEYEYFLTRHPKRPLVPIVGDETPLAEPLKERQSMTFVPVINELLELKRSMEATGRKKAEIQAAIRQRLEQAGIRLDKSDETRIFRFFGIAGWMAWLPAPFVLFHWIWSSLFEAAAQLSPAQLILMATVAAAAAAMTRQASMNAAKAREQKLMNQVNDARNTNSLLTRQSKAREHELANRVYDAGDRIGQLERQTKEREEESAKQFQRVSDRFKSHALIVIPAYTEPVLLKFIDSTTKQHRFTVQIPSNQDFSFWIPKGSYKSYFALTDISNKTRELVGGDVKRGLIAETEVESGQPYTFQIKKVENGPKPIPAEEWGQAGSGDKR
jgi:hypothetical protein